ncbi:hypothetical protein AMATHDRAFT_77948 [Amanita thiersii Skay4041]|uniref:Uncharacterized protein n=1 Tax=Amanita thiersii Skay4041 TaxID=703135 RepID=A0A2A9NBT3_9AGAR|nr:hypothetical protein AMATHDRAFT_77948 [Amanita thiersii Skay4041]
MSYLAYRANRSFVFEDYVWSHTPFPYTIYDFALRPARMPFNAFISGPTAGGTTTAGGQHDPSTRLAITAEFWESTCPPHRRHTLSSKHAPKRAEGDVLINWWLHQLAKVKNETCVEVDSKERPVFDWEFFGDKRILSLWPGLSTSPILTHFAWSPLVLSAVARSFGILRPSSAEALYDSLVPASNNKASLNHVLPGVVAIHIRRGDYKRHCKRLAAQSFPFMGFNQFPAFQDRFEPRLAGVENTSRWSGSSSSGLQRYDDEPYKSRLGYNNNNNESIAQSHDAHYMSHCLPTIPQIVAKLNAVRADNPQLKRVYILSNAWGGWLNSLRHALLRSTNGHPRGGDSSRSAAAAAGVANGNDDGDDGDGGGGGPGGGGGGWEEVMTSVDLVLDSAQRYVGMAVDMAIAERAEVFVGNGFSSLSSNVVMLRMARGMKPNSNRFL